MIYQCDECAGTIGLNKHISLVFAGNQYATGIALPPTIEAKDFSDEDLLAMQIASHIASNSDVRERWTVRYNSKLRGKFMHFCSSKCIGRYFGKLLKEADKKVIT